MVNCRHLNCSVSLREKCQIQQILCFLMRMSDAFLKSWEANAGCRFLWGLTALSLLPLQDTVYAWERRWQRWSSSSSSAACCRHSSSPYQKELRKSTWTLSLGAQWNPIHISSVPIFARLQCMIDLRKRHWYRLASAPLMFFISSPDSVSVCSCCVMCLRSWSWKIFCFSFSLCLENLCMIFLCIRNEINTRKMVTESGLT